MASTVSTKAWVCVAAWLACAGCSRDGLPTGGDEEVLPPVGEPRALVIGRATETGLGPLLVHDRAGRPVRDLSAGLDLGGDWAGVEVSVGDRVITVRPPARTTSPVLLTSSALSPWTETQVVVRALSRLTESPVVRLVGLSTSGRRTFDHHVDGTWGWFHLSPAGRYLFGDDGDRTGVVIDTRDGTVRYTARTIGALFSTDDSAFVHVVSGDPQVVVVIQPLPSGAPIKVAPPKLASAPATRASVYPIAAVPAGIVFVGGPLNTSLGRFLWILRLDGTWEPFDPRQETSAAEDYLGMKGDIAVFDRAAAISQTTKAPLGLFGYRPADATLRAYPAPLGTFGGGRLWTTSEERLETWGLDETAKQTVATFAPLDDAWGRSVEAVSRDGRVIALGTTWNRNAFPPFIPDDGALVITSAGERRLTLPAGFGLLDVTGRLYLHRTESLAEAGTLTVGDVEAGAASIIDPPRARADAFAILYEPPPPR